MTSSTDRHRQRWDRAVPAWVLLPQLFLAAGWMRAAVGNATTSGWWAGEVLRRFLEGETGRAITIYEPFLSHVVEPLAPLVATAVCAVELTIAVSLASNSRVLGALGTGAFLNVNFMLAGAVAPSTFYIVIAMVIVLWRLDHGGSVAIRRSVARWAAFVAGATALGLAPFVTTLHPARVIEDPAVVLIALSILFAVAAWSASAGDKTSAGSHGSPPPLPRAEAALGTQPGPVVRRHRRISWP